MGKAKRKKKQNSVKVDTFEAGDDDIPDSQDNSFYHDEIDEFHQQKEKVLLDGGAEIYEKKDESDEEEVLGVASDSDGEEEEIAEYERRLRKFQSKGFKDELASDVEEEEKGLPDDRAWGSERNKFYGVDVSDDDLLGDESDADAAALEEKEALAIQKKMADQLDDQDFALDIFKSMEKPKKSVLSEAPEVKIQQDLSQLTKKEKLDLVKKESPELLQLVEDYQLKMTELKDVFLPIQKLLKTGKLPPSSGSQYINTKVTLYLNYCINISFYMMLKAKRTPVENHPVIKRIVQYRNLIKQLESVDSKVLPEVQVILEKVEKGEELLMDTSGANKKKREDRKRKSSTKDKAKEEKPKKKLSELLSDDDSDSELTERQKAKKRKKLEREEGRYKTKGEEEALEYYEMMKAGRKQQPELSSEGEEDNAELGVRVDGEVGSASEEAETEEVEETDGKRAITYQIAKNKGLMPKRKKEQRNPRVKHKLKFRKAKIRRKGQVREVRTEMQKYGGELSGIRAGIKRSVKFK